MTDLVPIRRPESLGVSRAERRTARALDRVRSTEAIAIAQIEANQAIATADARARVAVVTDTTNAALLAASHISVVEALLADRTPHAEGRLHSIANAGCLALTDVVLTVSRRV